MALVAASISSISRSRRVIAAAVKKGATADNLARRASRSGGFTFLEQSDSHNGRIGDVRVRSHIVQTFRGHSQEVCILKWSNNGQYLASRGNDILLYIWDRSMASSNPSAQWLHKFDHHKAIAKALAWCDQFQSSLLAFGGGSGDHCIKLWNINTGACLNSIDTGSQVSSLLWSKNKRELLSSHATMLNQLILWKYPSMDKIAKLNGDVSGVLFKAESPNGCTVVSVGDEMLMFWNAFETPQITKPAKKTENAALFSGWMTHFR